MEEDKRQEEERGARWDEEREKIISGKEYEWEAEDEEGQKPQYKEVEPRPSEKEVEEHMLTHIPYRTGCPHCARQGAGDASQEE